MGEHVTFVVYNPPKAGLPFLAVKIDPHAGDVTAAAFETAEEAERFQAMIAAAEARLAGA